MRIRARLGRLKREVLVSIAPPLNHIVVEPLIAAFCDPLIAARVIMMTVEMCVSGEHAQQMEPRRPFAPHRCQRISLQLIITASAIRFLYLSFLYTIVTTQAEQTRPNKRRLPNKRRCHQPEAILKY